ncbi:MAG: hypothetical protein AB7P12_04770 [Alphaproteobacteria bacterium]
MTDKDDKPAVTDESQPVETRDEGVTGEAAPVPGGSETPPPDADRSDAEVMASAGDEQTGAKSQGDDRPPIPPPLARERRRKRSRGILVVLVLVAVVAGVAGAFWMTGWDIRDGRIVRPAATPAGTSPMIVPDVAALATRIERMAADIKALQERPYPLPVDDTRLTTLERQVKELSAALARLESGAKAEASQPRGPDPSALSLIALAAALDAGRPFAAHLQGAREALTGLGTEGQARLAALESIASRAATGVPTAAMLAARAGAVRRMAATAVTETTAPAEPPPADTLWGRIKARVGGLVTIRRIDDGASAKNGAGETETPAAKDDPAAPFAEAARLLAEGKMAEAETVLGSVAQSALPPPVRDAAKALVADIVARRAADRVATGAMMVPPPMGPAGDR